MDGASLEDAKGRTMGLETSDALDFARIRKGDWDSAIYRGLYPAPPITSGNARVFDTDDLIGAYCLGQLLEHEIRPAVAGEIATDIRRLIGKDHSIQRLYAWKVTKRDARVVVSETSPSPGAIQLFKFEIADIRMRAMDGIREKLRRDHAKAST
jgi:hypothetical protein